MALFGDLGKALGLGSAEDIFGEGDLLPILGTAAGFYFGGPLGASIGSGIGSLATGKSVNDALTNAAMAYGVSSFVSPSLMSSAAQGRTGMFGQSGIQQSLYGGAPTGIQSAGVKAPTVENMGKISDADLYDAAMSSDSKGIVGKAFDFMGDNKLLTAAIGSSLLGSLAGTPEEEAAKERPYAGGEAWSVTYQGVEYDLKNPDDVRAYTQAKAETQKPGFRYNTDEVFVRTAAHGGAIQGHPEAHGAMYRHDKMGYDVPVTGEVSGPGTGTSDSVPARLSDGEFVLTAKAVRGAGDGDRNIGAARLYDMMAELEATA